MLCASQVKAADAVPPWAQVGAGRGTLKVIW